MEIKKMQRIVDDWVKEGETGYWKPNNVMLRLMEEVGELSREVNHQFGQKKKKSTDDDNEISHEIADVIFTLTCLANSLDIDLEEAMQYVIKKYNIRDRNQ